MLIYGASILKDSLL